MKTSRLPIAGIALAALVALGCHAARLVVPLPLRAASAALYAVDVEFAEPLDRATAEDPSRYGVYPVGNPGLPAAISTATLIDTLDSRVVQLLIPAWFGDSSFDKVDMVVRTSGVLTWNGHATGTRTASFTTGLGYAANMKTLFDSHCNSCHGAALASGSYRTDSYAALFGNGTDATPNLIVGNPGCLLVKKCKPHNSMFNAAGLGYFEFELILNWIETYSARP